ncbi:unnamed protein product (macronuclear) [Paramecium tetraurelia]|uniref:G-patch domain-containing protein n=1 Tax=Paramecium tetraurelia TaxID=5888 RepID=A0C7M4_PARTE|nr:uncharacterized protein GSPATT00035921001 [Paramecium tetraurelia]CAK66791.1 unnamed protein product [Paramecium tetraurelia]|eukprot:XP_001434188.1 hypothetical protein (macronuclear) [Paramecium tetraurelia strain d4-2]
MNGLFPLLFEIDSKQEELSKQNQESQSTLSEEQNINYQQDDPPIQLSDTHKVFRKNQAFSNFIKHHTSPPFQVEKGVTIKMIKHHIQEQNRDENMKNVKSVQFNLLNNCIYAIVKHPNEYLSQKEKFNLSRRIQKYAIQNRFDSTSEKDEDQIEEQHSIIEIVVNELAQQPRSILKKQMQEFKHEADDEGDYFQNKGLTSREIRNLEKKVKEHDYGVGLQLLQKLGFKYGEGLGINRQGILEPVIPVKKQVFTGSLQNHNKVNEEDLIWQYDNQKENKNARKLHKLWRKRNQIDIQQDQEPAIIQSKVNADLGYLGEVSELTQSVQHLLLTKQMNEQQNISIENKKEKTLNKLEKHMEITKKNQSFKKYLLFFQEDDIKIQDQSFTLFQKFSDCFNKHPDLFIQFNLIDVLIQQGGQEIAQISKSWEGPKTDILENEFKLIYKIVNLGKDVIIYLKSQAISSNHQDSIFDDNMMAATNIINLQNIIDILIHPISQQLEYYICTHYDPKKENLLFEMLKLWSTDIVSIESDQIEERIQLFNSKTISKLSNLVIPKLKSTISNWNNRDNSIQLHKVLLPWIDSQFSNQDLSDQLIDKLMDIDLGDQPDFGFSILSPWSKLQGTQWNLILEKQIITKMGRFIKDLDVQSNFELANRILYYFDYIQDKIEVLFQPLIDKLNQHVRSRILENRNCKDLEVHKEIFQYIFVNYLNRWLNDWELILQEKVLNKVQVLSKNFNLIKRMLV